MRKFRYVLFFLLVLILLFTAMNLFYLIQLIFMDRDGVIWYLMVK